MGLLERHGGEVRCHIVPGTSTDIRLWKCKACEKQFSVKVGSIMEDSPIGLDRWLLTRNLMTLSFAESNHAERYVDGQIHTQGIENFWALLKRSIRGTYVSVEPLPPEVLH